MSPDAAHAESAHFHHVHLNVTDPGATMAFYKRHLGATQVRYRGVTDALFTEKSFILMTKVDAPPPTGQKSALDHIGWGGVDGPNEYEWLKSKGVRFQTPVSPLGTAHYMYFYGPDDELIEIYTGDKSHRFNHLHFFVADVNVTTAWLADTLGVEVRRRNVPRPDGSNPGLMGGIWMNALQLDNVSIVIFGKPEGENAGWWPEGLQDGAEPTKGRAIDHLAFSYRDIEAQFKRIKAAGVEIVEPIKKSKEFGHRSFFVLAPDGILVEIVEDKPIPEGIWE